MSKIKYMLLAVATLFGAATMFSSCSSDDDDIDSKAFYDVIQINGESYACYGYRAPITYFSEWNSEYNVAKIMLPCSTLSDAEKSNYDYDYCFDIRLEINRPLKKGDRLENFSPICNDYEDINENLDYMSGSATVTDKNDDKYITIKFNSFKFEGYGRSYVYNGTVQLDWEEDSYVKPIG